MTRRFFGNLLGVHRPDSGIFTLGELGPSTTGALTRPQLRWGGILGRSTLLGGGSGGALFLTLNQIMRTGTNSDVSSGTVAVVKGAGNVTSGTERWQTYNLLNTGSFTLANEAEVTFEVWGAAGGSGTSSYAGLGGGGEYRKATFTLAPGTYYYVCGAGGGCGDSAYNRSGSGGFGGGGVGGAYDTNNTGPSATAFGVGGYNSENNIRSAIGGGGGGLTGIFTSTTPSQSSALIVAGGGGGYGHSNGAGLPGGDTTSKSGTASSGGVAPANAEDGSAGKGGSGEGRGGGGGGGYWGGAGGGDGTSSPGGGGGRGYTDGAGFNTTTTAGSGNTPGGTSSVNYVSGYGASNGSSHTSGGGGLIAISAVEVAGRFTTTGLIKLSELQQIRLGPSSASTVFPVFSSGSTASFPEGGTGAVYTAVAADSDNNAITFGLGSSKDEALFSINASGQVFFLTTPDFESPADGNTDNVYDIDIIATNGVNATTQAVTITVSDQNDPPVITSASTASFQENGTGTAYTITATDPNGDGITFTLGSSNDEALFNIVNNLVAFNTSPDFESPSDANADNAYIIEVIATDSVGNSASQLVTINVTDDPTDITAPVISGSSSISAQENTTTTSTILETFTATGGGTLSWSLTGADAANFSINSSGELTFSSSPDFENPADANTDNSYDVTVNVSNQAGSDTLAVAVSVTDDTADNPIAPQISGPSTATFQENGTGAVATYTIQAGTTPITFSLSGTDAARFSISSSGVVTFNSPPDYESPTDSGSNNVYNLTVTASNAGGSTSTPLTVTVTNDTSDDMTITIEDVNLTVSEKPTSTTTLVRFKAMEGSTNVSQNLNISITPSDVGFTSVMNNANTKKLVKATGGATLGGGVHVNTNFTITASGTSSDGLTSSASRTVDVQDKTLITGGTKLVEPSSSLARNIVNPNLSHVTGTLFCMVKYNSPSVGSVQVTRIRISDGLYTQYEFTLPSSNSTAHKTVRQAYVLNNVLYVMTNVDTYNGLQRPLVYKRDITASSGAMTFVDDVFGWSGGSSVPTGGNVTSFNTSNRFWMRDDASNGSGAEWRAFSVSATSCVELSDNIRFTTPPTNLASAAHVWGNYVLFDDEYYSSGPGRAISVYSFNQSTTQSSYLGSLVQADDWRNLKAQAGYSGTSAFSGGSGGDTAVYGNYLYYYHYDSSLYAQRHALYRFNISNIAGSE